MTNILYVSSSPRAGSYSSNVADRVIDELKKTDPGATVTINDEDVEVESNGHFKKLVSFNKVGRNAVVVKALNASGKTNVQSVIVIVEE